MARVSMDHRPINRTRLAGLGQAASSRWNTLGKAADHVTLVPHSSNCIVRSQKHREMHTLFNKYVAERLETYIFEICRNFVIY